MAKWVIDSDTLVDIADAVRAKLGTSESILVSNLASAIESIPYTPTPVAKILSGLKVTKTTSRYTVGSTIATDDFTCVAVYTDNTEATVTPTISASGASSANVGITYISVSYGGISGNFPITIYDTGDDNLLQLTDMTTPMVVNGVTIYIKDNVIHLNGTATYGSNYYLKITNTEAWATSAQASWKAESIPFTSGNTYSLAKFEFGGSMTGEGSGTFSVRDSSGSSLLSASNTPQTFASNAAYIHFYWKKGATFRNYACACKIVSGSTTPNAWSYTPVGSNSCTMYFGNATPLVPIPIPSNSVATLSIGYSVFQGIAYHNGYLYCGVSNTSGASAMDYTLAKVNVSGWTLVGTVQGHTLGHCNDVTYCDYDGYLHCVDLDDYGTIHRIDTSLNYIDSYTIDISSQYAEYTGVGAISYCPEKQKFVALARGTSKKYIVLSKDRVVESIHDVDIESGTYGGVLTDADWVYQMTSGGNIIKYNWDFERIEAYNTQQSFEHETMSWYSDGDMIFNGANGKIYRNTLERQTT